MTQPSRFIRLAIAASALALASPLHAEGNRLLPFWAQPYPYGYAYVERDILPPCRSPYRHDQRQGRNDDPRCQVVLHARD